jgi:hypothetical protein
MEPAELSRQRKTVRKTANRMARRRVLRPFIRCEIDPRNQEGDIIDQTVDFWQERTPRSLTREDGREIIENMTGFFRILDEWDRTKKRGRPPRK